MQPLPSKIVRTAGSHEHLPPQRPASAFVDEPVNEVQRLADEIDFVLSGRERSVRRTMLPTMMSSADRGAEPLSVPPGSAWKDSGRHDPSGAAEQVGRWLGRAKRERRFQTLRSVVSWAVALGFAFGIATIAGLLLSGNMPYLDDIARVTRTFGL